ncbi:hypothetical protein CC78DRAFT_614241 [Lojkania enalia]|uniref:Uncharacterized protein n=1 Tax=Lojkania enalia TaxID=147567 RepID=A0A9P4N5N4_9PLEO|nr:hypothetical protein CC78DRAFT_614241 [Didymosphaeria enalia]
MHHSSTEAGVYFKEITFPTTLFVRNYGNVVALQHFLRNRAHKSTRTNLLLGGKATGLAGYPIFPSNSRWRMGQLRIRHPRKRQDPRIYQQQTISFSKLDKLNNDLRAILNWHRRNMLSQHKIRTTIGFMQWWKDADLDCLIENYEYLARSIDESGRRLENILPVIRSPV